MKITRKVSLLFMMMFGFLVLGVAANAQQTVSFFHKWPEPRNMYYFEKAVAEFEAANPDINIKMEAVADEAYKDKIRVLMASDQVPDVFFSWPGEFGRQFSRNGRSLDITDAVNGSDWKNSFPDAFMKPFTYNDRQYGVPMNIDAKFMVYNKKIFVENGISVPQNYADFLAACAKLKDAGITPIAFGNQYPWAASHYVGELIAKFVPKDVKVADFSLLADDEVLYTHPGYAKALEEFQHLNDEGYFNRGSNALPHSIARGSFSFGRNAMMYMEMVEFIDLKETKLAMDGWDFFKLPKYSDDEADFITGAPEGFMISAKSAHPEAAIKFLKFLTSPEQGKKYFETTGMTSAINGAINAGNADANILKGVEEINTAVDLALWLDTDMDARTTEVFLAGTQAVLTGSETPAEIMVKVRETAINVKAARQ